MSKESFNSKPQSNHNIAEDRSRHCGAWTRLAGLKT